MRIFKKNIARGQRGWALCLIPLILGVACARAPHRLTAPRYVLVARPDRVPALIDGSPRPCPECRPVNGQPMWKFTARDILRDQVQHVEKDDYIDYLLELIGE